MYLQDSLIAMCIAIYSLHAEASAPTSLTAVQKGPTSIRVSWNPPSPLGETTGYRIYYNSDSDGDSEDVSGGSRKNYKLTGLQNGVMYTISIVGTSLHLPSDKVETTIYLGNGLLAHKLCKRLHLCCESDKLN